MNLEELNLNRNLTKDGGSSVDAVSKSMSNASVADDSNPDAPQVLTGTVISSCIVQSSASPDRVELSPYVTSETGAPSEFTKLESLIAYAGNIAQVIINKKGIYGVNSSFTNVVAQRFFYGQDSFGNIIPQPQSFVGIIKGDGTGAWLPPGWSSVKNSTGNYTITHNLNSHTYTVMVTPINSYYNLSINNFITNTFDVYSTKYSFDGTGLFTTISPVDGDFTFTLLRIYP